MGSTILEMKKQRLEEKGTSSRSRRLQTTFQHMFQAVDGH